MLKKRTILNECIFVLTIFISLFLFTEVSFSTDMFLIRCMKIAESRDQKLAIAYEQIKLAQSRTIRAARSFFPQVMFQHTASKGTTAMALKNDGSGNFDDYEYKSESYGIKVSQPIYEGYRTRGAYEYESMMVTAAKFNYTKIREELFSKVKLAYYEYITLKQEYNALASANEIVSSLFNKIQKEYKAKAISQLDLLEAEHFKDKIYDMYEAAHINMNFSLKKLINVVGINDVVEVNAKELNTLPDDVPEISFSLDSLLKFVLTNNLDVQTAKVQTDMANMKIKINISKIIPKFYVDGFYGKSGEAFTTNPLELSTSWNVAGRLSWGLWGNSLEATLSKERTDPTTIVDASKRVDTVTQDIKFSLLDDLGYFVDAKESKVGFNQTSADYVEVLKTKRLDSEKAYNDYLNSLNNTRTFRKEITYRKKKLDLLKKQNSLYAVSTVNLMEETLKYAEAISGYAKATYQNYSSVTEMETLTLIPLR
ncbi:MAG: TolC family protein [Endomicrobium sp.]|nr:TolC family protein [Endomicrobium sp.]